MAIAERVLKSGAYVWANGFFPFVVGPTPQGNRLAVVRLGGHREPGESPWECTRREAAEEAGILLQPVTPPATYWYRRTLLSSALQPGPWPGEPADGAQPVLVIQRGEAPGDQITLMYLARSSQAPTPSGEVQGLLLLRPTDVLRLCRRPITLREYRKSGGRVVLRQPMNDELLLEPGLQLHLLARLLRLRPAKEWFSK